MAPTASNRRRSASGQPPSSQRSTRSVRRSSDDDAPTSAATNRADRAARRSSTRDEEADDATDDAHAHDGYVGPYGSRVNEYPWNALQEPNSIPTSTGKSFLCCVPDCTRLSASARFNFMCRSHCNEYLAARGSKGDIAVPPKQEYIPYSQYREQRRGNILFESDDEEEEDEDDDGPTGNDGVDFSSTSDEAMDPRLQLEERLDNYVEARKAGAKDINGFGKAMPDDIFVRSGGVGRSATESVEPSSAAVEMWTSVSAAPLANNDKLPQGINGIFRGDLCRSSGKVEFEFVHGTQKFSEAWKEHDPKLVSVGFSGEGHLIQVRIGGPVHVIEVTIGTYPTQARARAAFALFQKTLVQSLGEGRHALSLINDKVKSALDGKL